jgi:hypothetical protein
MMTFNICPVFTVQVDRDRQFVLAATLHSSKHVTVNVVQATQVSS